MEENFLLKNNKSLFKMKFNFLNFVIFVFLFFIIFGILIFLQNIKAPKDFNTELIFSIESGDSVRSVSKKLEENNFIKSRALFETFVILFGGEKNIKTGAYLFKEKLNVIRIAQRISDGEKGLSPIKTTIPEGYTNEEIANLFKNKLPNFDKENFLSLAQNYQGYLFPDTYFVLYSDDEKIVFDMLRNNFNKKTEKVFDFVIGENRQEKINEYIIMASLIEGEASGDSDREIISGILWKRLAINMPLQVDVAKITYEKKGLPSNPISNPGLKAINASINPKSSPYLYYIHDKNGNTYYARDFKAHRANIEKYLK